MNRSILGRVLNCFIDVLNQKSHLPRYVLIIIDKDWFETSGILKYGAGEAVTKAVKWWMKEMNKFIEIRKDHLYSKKPGAIAVASEPRFIWVTMVKRPYIRNETLASIFSLTRKSNVNLENALVDERHTHTLKVNTASDGSNFDNWGRLNATGKVEFWKNVDEQFKDFDRSKTDLKPSKSAPRMSDVAMFGTRRSEY